MTVHREIVETKRGGQAQPRRTEAYFKQYVQGLSGQHVRRMASRSGESAIAAEAFMNNAG
jgi:hypothetical protein